MFDLMPPGNFLILNRQKNCNDNQDPKFIFLEMQSRKQQVLSTMSLVRDKTAATSIDDLNIKYGPLLVHDVPF